MTVASALNRKTFAGDDITTSFATTPIKFFATSDLQVYITTTATGVTTLRTEGTHYTVSGGDASAGAVGTVDLSGGSSPHGALLSGTTLVILRELPLLQGVDFVQNDASNAEVAEAALDKLVMNAQRLDDRLDRSLVISDGDVSGADFTVPTPAANTILGWDGTGTALVNYIAADIAPDVLVTPFAETLLDDVDAATMRTTLGAVIGTNVQAWDADLDAIAALAKTDGNFIVGNGSAWVAENGATARASLDVPSTGVASKQVFTSSATWTKPSGVKFVVVEVQGGGAGSGGGLSASGTTSAGGGGGAGGYARKLIDVSGIASSTVTVGTAGAAGNGAGTAGGNGVASSWADGTNTVTGNGGTGGGHSNNGAGLLGTAGAGGTATGGDININGQAGTVGVGFGATAPQWCMGGSGGASFLGGGGIPSRTTSGGALVGNAGHGYGAGAGGAAVATTSNAAGAAGTAGIVIVWEFK